MSTRLICTVRYFELDEVKYATRIFSIPEGHAIVALAHEGPEVRHIFYGK